MRLNRCIRKIKRFQSDEYFLTFFNHTIIFFHADDLCIKFGCLPTSKHDFGTYWNILICDVLRQQRHKQLTLQLLSNRHAEQTESKN